MKNQWMPLPWLFLGIFQGCLALGQDLSDAQLSLPQKNNSVHTQLRERLKVSRERVPSGFEVVKVSPGASLYSKNLDYVQAIDLGQGASVQFLSGNIAERGRGKGAYGGDDPQFERQTLEEAWVNLRRSNQAGFCITNGQFFRDDKNSSTGLAFPVKVDGEVISDGYAGESEYPQEKMMLEVWGDRASITPFDASHLYASSAPNIIVSLKADADKGINRNLGRTFIGVKDGNADGTYETILIFNSKSSTQPHAARVLRDFGASQVMMLDGGGSTQLLCQGRTYVSSPGTIPQTIAVLSAASPKRPRRI